MFATEGPTAEEQGSAGHEDGEESLDEVELPPEIVHLENEAFGTQYKAKQKIAEVRKLRQYYKQPEQNEERRRLKDEDEPLSQLWPAGPLVTGVPKWWWPASRSSGCQDKGTSCGARGTGRWSRMGSVGIRV